MFVIIMAKVYIGGIFMANSEPIFSKVFRGFSPDEVVAYIDILNAAYKTAKAESEAKINSLTDELNAAKRAAGECDAVKSIAEEKQHTITEQQEEIERLNADAENQRLAMVAQSEKISELEEVIMNLKSELEAQNIKNAAMIENSKEYEKMLADVDSILATSRRRAQDLIAEAEKKADEIIANAEKDAREKYERIMSEADIKLDENVKKVRYLQRRQDELAELFRDHKSKVNSFFASISDNDK